MAIASALLTGGGDCPGLNAVIRAVVRRGLADGEHSFVGFRYGWAGVLARRRDRADARRAPPGSCRAAARSSAPRAPTPTPTAPTAPRRSRARCSARGVDVLIPIGGEDTLGVALRLHDDGVPVVGVPKTIDNDLGGTDVTFGFQTAVQIVTDAIDRLHTTAESHNRVMVVEVMGRHAGWIATHAGIAGGADAILVPERPFDIDEVVAHLRRRHARGRSFSIVVVAEGATPREGTLQTRDGTGTDAFGHARLGGIGVALEGEIERAHRLSRRASRSSATCSAAARPSPTTACSPRASAWPRWTPPPPGASARWSALRGTEIVEVAARARRCASRSCSTRALYETAELFFG